MLSKGKTLFVIVCFILGISSPFLLSRFDQHDEDVPHLTFKPSPEKSKWAKDLKLQEVNLVVSTTLEPTDNTDIRSSTNKTVTTRSKSKPLRDHTVTSVVHAYTTMEKKKITSTTPKSPSHATVTNKPKGITYIDNKTIFVSKKEVSTGPIKDYWTKHVQLCIMFNLNRIIPNPLIINILLDYYHPLFDHITLIFNGEWKKRPKYLPDYVKFMGCESHIGWYQHRCLKMCLNQPTDDKVKGFFYIADDMFINLHNLAKYSLSKAWCMTTGVYDYNELMVKDKQEIHKIWMWWGPPLSFEKALKVVVDTLPKKWIHLLHTNVGFPDKYHGKGIFDIIYLPKSMAPNMTKVLTHILDCKTDLFCELAGPLAVGIVVPKDQKIEFTSSFLWGYQRNVDTIREAAQKKLLDVVHAVKLSEPDKAALWKELMVYQLRLAASL